MRPYRFERSWELRAPPDRVIAAIVDTSDWVERWPWLESLENVVGTHHDHRGRVQRYVLRAPLGYRLRVTGHFLTTDHPRRLRAHLRGDVEGQGDLVVIPTPAGSRFSYRLSVRPTLLWMRLLQPLLRPAFAAGHRRVIDAGVRALAGKVGSPPPGRRVGRSYPPRDARG